MAYRNSIEERIFILEKSFQGDAPYIQTTFVEKFPGKVPPSRQTIHALKKNFERLAVFMMPRKVVDLCQLGVRRIKKQCSNSIMKIQAHRKLEPAFKCKSPEHH